MSPPTPPESRFASLGLDEFVFTDRPHGLDDGDDSDGDGDEEEVEEGADRPGEFKKGGGRVAGKGGAEPAKKDEPKTAEPAKKDEPKATDAPAAGKEPSGKGAAGVAPRVPEQTPSLKAQRAKASHHLIDKRVQRYAEEHNEPHFAKAMGGTSFPDGEPIDVGIQGPDGKPRHGIELKTMVDNKASKITMKASARQRKDAWEKETGGVFHTVVLDDQKVFNAKGEGQHDESQRVIYYRRGHGSFRVSAMHRVKDMAELKQLLEADEAGLPPAARRVPFEGGK